MTMLSPEDPRAPKFWRFEMGGKLIPAIERYLAGGELEDGDVELIRAYIWQWVISPVWDVNPAMTPEAARDLRGIRSRVSRIKTRADIETWIRRALDMGIDPL